MRLQLIAILFLLFYNSSLSPKELYFKHILIGEELSSFSAVSICQDIQGRIWFGNDHLNVYDGEMVQSFRLSDYIPDLIDNNIHMLCGDNASRLFFLADRRFVIFNIASERFVDTAVDARALYFHENDLYYTSDNCLYKFNENEEDECLYTLTDPAHIIQSLRPFRSGWLLGTNLGLFYTEKNDSELLLLSENISCLFMDASERLWVGTPFNGAYVYQHDRWEHFREHHSDYPLIGNQVRCINQDENKNIWIGTYSGIMVIDSSLTNSYSLTHDASISWSLRHSSVYAIFRDLQGGMWIGTYYGGMSYFNPDSERFHYFDVHSDNSSKLNGFIFGQMTEDDKGNVYIATENGGLNKIYSETNEIKRFDSGKSRIPSATTKSVWFDKERDCLYIGTFLNGLLIYHPVTDSFEQVGDRILNTSSRRIITNLIPWNNYLLLVTQGGLFLLDRTTKHMIPLYKNIEEQQKTEDIIHTAYLDSRERLWITPAHQEIQYISLNDGKVHKPAELNKRIGKNRVNSICEDTKGNLFFLVSGVGLLCYDIEKDQFQCYSKESGSLFTNESFKSIFTEDDHLIITFSRGFTLLNLLNKESRHVFFENISPLSGLNPNCGILMSSANNIFIGGIEGLIAVNKNDLSINSYSYDLMFNFISINNRIVSPNTDPERFKKSITYTEVLKLPHNYNNISLGFVSTNYRHSATNMFAYKLEGRDNQWTRTSHNNLTYTSLAPGKYRLIVREMNSDKQISMNIQIHPPFYASTWAWCLYSLAIVLFTGWLIRFYRSRSILKTALEQEQAESQKTEEMNQVKLDFYVNISHELRTPLTLMISQLDLILKEDTKALRNKLVKLKRYTSQMQQLITEILDLRKLEQNKMPLQAYQQNIIHFVRDIFLSFQDYAAIKHIQYVMLNAEETIPVYFDSIQLRKAINNLLFNAFKFTPENGNIIVQIISKEHTVDIVISDSGCGIAAEDKAHIFNLFYQSQLHSSNRIPGTGIGLALTREIIAQHKGSVSVESEVGKGSVFTLSLLLNNAHIESRLPQKATIVLDEIDSSIKLSDLKETEIAQQELEPERRRATILIVEDNDELSLLLKEALLPMYNVYSAMEGETGIKMARQYNPDLIISDIMMPNLSGIEMYKELKKRFETSHIPIIFLTAHTEQKKELEALHSGANDFLVKPFHMEILLLKCRNIILNRYKLQQRFLSEAQTLSIDIAVNKDDQKLLDNSTRIIEEHLEDHDFTIDTWCREIAIGRTRLTEKIKRITGLTLNDFILQAKLRKCVSLLKDRNITISEIAWMSGFSSSSYMGKCFKEYFGMTPLQFRNKGS